MLQKSIVGYTKQYKVVYCRINPISDIGLDKTSVLHPPFRAKETLLPSQSAYLFKNRFIFCVW